MMFILYDLIFLLLALFYFPYVLLKKKWHKGFRTRLGFVDKSSFAHLKDTKNIWIHAVSVGEVIAIVDLVKSLQKKYPDYHLVFSTVTQTGNALAQKHFPQSTVIYAPLDFSWVVRAYIRLIRPEIYVSAETEIWPNLYFALHKKSIPIIQVNGRISDKAFKGYQRFRFLVADALRCVSVFCMQSQIDADRVIRLGAWLDTIKMVGNLKFDIPMDIDPFDRRELCLSNDDLIFTAGSTHPGEESIVIQAYRELKKDFPHLKLVLAPRHVERVEELESLLAQENLAYMKFSERAETHQKDFSVVLIDTIGHLRQLYAISDAVFIGKTFHVGGGQNMIEPLFFGKPTFVGPLTQNFKSVMDLFLKEQIVFVVNKPTALAASMKTVLSDPEKITELAEKAKNVVLQHQGASEKTLREFESFLKGQE